MEFGMIKLKELISLNYQIFLDLDGVLTDFDKQMKSIGITSDYEEKHGTESFWGAIDKGGLKWWSEMPWMSDGKTLWNYVKDKNVKILSAPARRLPQSIKGKKIWVSKNLGKVELILKRASEKQHLAESNAILIDDLAKNINQWKAAGGIGILHKSASSTIQQLKEVGI